ncbi:MAG: sporulation protein YunB [Ruminococcaceae bacterium]|nr:sporulation protein YunB [Oscillospiraceae bacterium]
MYGVIILRCTSKKKSRSFKIFSIILIFISLLIIFIIVDLKTRPIVKSSLAAQADREAVKIINDIVIKELEDVTYESLVDVSRDNENNVTSIQTNIKQLNLLKARLNKEMLSYIEKMENEKIKIALGTLTGNEFLLGRGPEITYILDIYGIAHTSFINNFEAVGINQTRHSIFIEITVDVGAILTGYRTSSEVTTSVLAAETIIVGKVPQFYSGYNRLIENLN